MVQVIRAEAMGMCFGVRDALALAMTHRDASKTTVFGELVHNAKVNRDLQARGYQVLSEEGREDAELLEQVLITAHGISQKQRRRLSDAGHRLIDTTCPLVTKLHNAALRLQAGGFHPVIIGKEGHVEVAGVIEDLENYTIVSNLTEARDLRLDVLHLGIVAQTTYPESSALEIVAEIRSNHADANVRFVNTICEPTRQRQRAAEAMFGSVEFAVVVGGVNSNNTLALVAMGERMGVKVWHVQDATQLLPQWFVGVPSIGLTAGTSTEDSCIDAVEDAMHHFSASSIRSSA